MFFNFIVKNVKVVALYAKIMLKQDVNKSQINEFFGVRTASAFYSSGTYDFLLLFELQKCSAEFEDYFI